MAEHIDWEAYYQQEAAIFECSPCSDMFAIHRCLAAWLVLPHSEMESLIDVGCGDGYFCHWIAERVRVARIVGVDVSRPRIQRAMATYPEVEYAWGRLPKLPFRADEFQVATCIEVLEHQEEPVAALREVARIVQRHVVITVPDRREPQTVLCPHCLKTFPASGHLHFFDPSGLAQTVQEAGLKVENLKVYYSAPYAARNLLLRLAGRCLKGLRTLMRPQPRGKYLACLASKRR